MSRAETALVAALGLSIALSLWLLLTFGYGRDQGIYAVVGRTILEGGMPYRDAWDFKPPGIFLIFATSRALLGQASWAIRALEVASALSSVAAMIALAQRWWNRWAIGLLAGALACLVHAQLDFWHSAQPETFGGALSMVALWMGSGPRQRARALVAAGLLFGFAGLLKPPMAGGGLALAIWLGATSGGSTRERLAPALWIALGGVLPFAACTAWFILRGADAELVEVLLGFTPHYTALGWHGRHFGSLLYEAAVHWLLDYSAPIVVGVALLALGWRRVERRTGVSLLAGLALLQIVGVALQGKFFPYHYAGLWPACALLAALGWWTLGRVARRHGRVALALVVVALLTTAPLRTATKDVEGHFWWRTAYRLRVFALGMGSQDDRDRLASVSDVDAARNRRVAQQLRDRVAVGEPIYVWGFEPVLYDLADRPSSSRFIYNVPQRAPWWAERSRRRLMEDLRARPPQAIVVSSGDTLPMVTGDGVDSATALDSFDELRDFLEAGYGQLMLIDGFALYLRR